MQRVLRSLSGSCLSLALIGGAAGLVHGGCKRPSDIFELDPLDSASMASCSAHGPLQVTCDACNGGATDACLKIAKHYEQRHDLGRRDRDARIAALYYGRACVQGYAPGCVIINDHYSSIRGLDYFARKVAAERRDSACEHVASACAAKDAVACRVEGMCLAEEWPQRKTARDVPGALRALASSCDAGDARGCAELGWLRAREAADPAALTESYAANERACKLESVQGCLAAASQQQYGFGTPAAPEAAATTFATWCERGSAEACHAARGYFAGLRSLLKLDASSKSLGEADKTPINRLELRPAYVTGVGRVGFCVDATGKVERAETLESSGPPELDKLILDSVSGWRFAQPATGVPFCSVHEQRVVFTFRSTGSRPFFTLWETWTTPRGGTVLLDLDPLR